MPYLSTSAELSFRRSHRFARADQSNHDSIDPIVARLRSEQAAAQAFAISKQRSAI
jgi:hypothetical protein